MYHVWRDVPGFGTIEPMATRPIDPRSQEAFAARVKAFRQAKGQTQAAFARTLEISNQGVWNWEKGGQIISMPLAYRWTAAHGVDLPFIYEGILKCLDDDLKLKFLERLKNPKEPGEPD